MKRFIVIAVVLLLTACSSAPPRPASQFCNTSKTVEVVDGKSVSSKTTVKCSDDFVERHIPARVGVDQNCKETINEFVLKGQLVQRRGIACETHRPGHFIYIPSPNILSN
jgi:hypothetical protein